MGCQHQSPGSADAVRPLQFEHESPLVRLPVQRQFQGVAGPHELPELERLGANQVRRQREGCPGLCHGPIQLHHARHQRKLGKVPRKVDEIPGNLPGEACLPIPCAVLQAYPLGRQRSGLEQALPGRQRELALHIPGQAMHDAPAARQCNDIQAATQMITQRVQHACTSLFTPRGGPFGRQDQGHSQALVDRAQPAGPVRHPGMFLQRRLHVRQGNTLVRQLDDAVASSFKHETRTLRRYQVRELTTPARPG